MPVRLSANMYFTACCPPAQAPILRKSRLWTKCEPRTSRVFGCDATVQCDYRYSMEAFQTDILIGYESALRLFGQAGGIGAVLQTELAQRRIGNARQALTAFEKMTFLSGEMSGYGPEACLLPDFLTRTLTSHEVLETVRNHCPVLLDHLPVDLVVMNAETRLQSKAVRCRTWNRAIPAGGIVRFAEHLFLSSPEFAFVQLARGNSMLRLAYIASGLCGAYCRDDSSLMKRRPLTTLVMLALYLEAMEREPDGLHMRRPDGWTKARRALSYAIEGARSPEEIACGMLLGMPTRLGGFGLGMPLSNPSITISISTSGGERLVERFPDLYWPERKLIVEYDSDAFHTGGRRRGQDANRVLEFRAAGYTVVSLTTSQLFTYGLLENAARQMIAETGTERQLKRFDETRLRMQGRRTEAHRVLVDCCLNGLV